MGDQNVGKTSIINRFMFDAFDGITNVIIFCVANFMGLFLFSLLVESILSLKLYNIQTVKLDYNYGILLDKKDLGIY